MEYVKTAFKCCFEGCKCCCLTARKESQTSTTNIIPSQQKREHRMVQAAYTGMNLAFVPTLQQPNFLIPSSAHRIKHGTEQTSSKSHELMHLSAVQPNVVTHFYDSENNEMDSGSVESDDIIQPEEDLQNMMHYYRGQQRRKSVPSTTEINSPTLQLPTSTQRRVSYSHSRRSSMGSFDISAADVDSQLYSPEPSETRGKISFSLFYSGLEKVLTVHVISAKGLDTPTNSNPDTYVKVTLVPQQKKLKKNTTLVHKSNANPTYNQTFTFHQIHSNELSVKRLKLVVYTFDKHSHKHILGGSTYQLAQLLEHSRIEKIWKPLLYHDEINEDRGSMLLSVNYHPPNGVLEIIVMEAKHLRYPDTEKITESISVKVALVEKGKVTKKEKTQQVPPSSNPLFDVTIKFDLPNSDVHQTCIFVVATAILSNNKKEYLGYICIGPPFYASGTGLEQWTKMLSLPFRAVSKWHPLSSIRKDITSFNSFNSFVSTTLNPK